MPLPDLNFWIKKKIINIFVLIVALRPINLPGVDMGLIFAHVA